MPRRPQLQSEIRKYIRGIENVHCVVSDPEKGREFYTSILGPPKHRDGAWSEFEAGGLEMAVTGGTPARSVITLRVENLAALHSLLEELDFRVTEILHGDYGDFVEVSPDEGFILHFFEPKKKCESQGP